MALILTIGRLLYDAAHLVAVFLTVFLMGPMLAVGGGGGGVGWLPALGVVLLGAAGTGGGNPRGGFGTLAAALVLPAVLGSGELLFRTELFGESPLEGYLCFFLLILLLGSILIRGPGWEEGQRAELLLERGCELAIPEVIWLHLLGGAVLLVSTFGLLLVVILGELMAQNGSLFDYGGLAGVLLGLLALHLVQVLMFWRGLRLAKERFPDRIGRWSPLVLWVPIVNLVWAGRLRSRLWNSRMEGENHLWAQL